MSVGAAHEQSLGTRIVTTTDGLHSLRGQWAAVLHAGGNRNPFARWEWTYHWWRLFGRTHGNLRDQLHILVHMDAEGDPQGITPLVRTDFTYGPVRITKLRNAGSVPGAYITEMYPYIWAQDYAVPVARALASELYRRRGEYHWAEINTVPLDSPFGHELAESYVGTRGSWQSPTPYFPLALPATWDALKGRMTRNAREHLRQTESKVSRLIRAGHTCGFDVLEDRDAVLEGLEELFRLHAARSTMTSDAHAPHYHPDQFASASTREFMRSVASDLAVQGAFSIARMRIDGQTAACRVLLPANDELFLFHSGFDPQWKDYNVMAAVTARCIRRAIQSAHIRVVNLSTNLDRSKLQWKPEEGHLLGNVRLTASTLGRRGVDMVNANMGMLRSFVDRLGPGARPLASD